MRMIIKTEFTRKWGMRLFHSRYVQVKKTSGAKAPRSTARIMAKLIFSLEIIIPKNSLGLSFLYTIAIKIS